MRSQKDRETIESYLSDPYQIMEFITEDERQSLIDFFYNHKNHIHKHTGPTTVNLTQDELALEPFKSILKKIKSEIGDFRVWAAVFFKASREHIIHNDDSYEWPVCYKGINIPLEFNGNITDYPSLCFFDQYYLEGPSKFFRNNPVEIKAYYNASVYDYKDVKNITNQPFPKNLMEQYLPHFIGFENHLEGLTLNSVFQQFPRSAIIFDSVRLHCASNYKLSNMESKLGLSIFTEKL